MKDFNIQLEKLKKKQQNIEEDIELHRSYQSKSEIEISKLNDEIVKYQQKIKDEESQNQINHQKLLQIQEEISQRNIELNKLQDELQQEKSRNLKEKEIINCTQRKIKFSYY